MAAATTVDDPVAVETAPLVDETSSAKLLRAPSAKQLRAQARITDLKRKFQGSLPKQSCAIQQQLQQPFDSSTKESSLASGLAAVQRDSIMPRSKEDDAFFGRGESGPARQHAHVLPSAQCSRTRTNTTPYGTEASAAG